MECPYKIPVRVEYNRISDMWVIFDSEDKIMPFFDFPEAELKFLAYAINSHEKFKILLRDSTNILTGLMQENDAVDSDCPTTFSHHTLQHLTRQRKANKQALKEAEKE